MVSWLVRMAVLLVATVGAAPAWGADPLVPFNPLKAFVRSPFGAEVEVYSGGITGKSVGAAYQSISRGDYGVRFTFGFLRALHFNLSYMYSNQTRSFTAVTPLLGPLPSGTSLMRAANLNVFYGSGELSLLRLGKSSVYLSPGIGFARNGARSMTLITPVGVASAPILPGTAVAFSLGAGVKIFPRKHLGFRIDVRDYLSGGGTGNLNTNLTIPGPTGVICAVGNPNCTSINPAPFFGSIPVQNNLVFTLGLIFKII